MKALVGVAALAVMGGVLAAPAHADSYSGYPRDEAHYLRVLHTDNPPELDRDLAMFSDDTLVVEGHRACNGLALGWTHPRVWAGIRRDLGLPYSSNVDAAITGSATNAFCPKYGLSHSAGPGE